MSYGKQHPPGRNGSDCGISAIDELACKAQGIKRRAEVTQESLDQLEGFKGKFTNAKTDYGNAREAARPEIQAASKKLEAIHEQLRCRLNEEQRSCVEGAVVKVFGQIEECVGEPGCSRVPCEFDPDCHEGDTVSKLKGRIARYREEVGKAADYFSWLIAEQKALVDRATKLHADANQLATDANDVNADAPTLFARLLVAEHQHKAVWKGFHTVQDYVDCLCKTLVCILQGWEAIAILEGRAAEEQCKLDGEEAFCQYIQANTVAEVMTEYYKCVPDDYPSTGHHPAGSPC